MKTVQLKVPTITCEGCVDAIRGALGKRKGIQTVDGDSGRKEIRVTFNPEQVGERDIRQAVAEAGFVVG